MAYQGFFLLPKFICNLLNVRPQILLFRLFCKKNWRGMRVRNYEWITEKRHQFTYLNRPDRIARESMKLYKTKCHWWSSLLIIFFKKDNINIFYFCFVFSFFLLKASSMWGYSWVNLLILCFYCFQLILSTKNRIVWTQNFIHRMKKYQFIIIVLLYTY